MTIPNNLKILWITWFRFVVSSSFTYGLDKKYKKTSFVIYIHKLAAQKLHRNTAQYILTLNYFWHHKDYITFNLNIFTTKRHIFIAI